MTQSPRKWLALIVCVCGVVSRAHAGASSSTSTTDVYFDVSVPDPYRWLEDGRSQAVQDWVHDQDTKATAYLAALPGRDALAQRLQQLVYVNSISVPQEGGKRLFYIRREASKEKAALYVRGGEQGAERTLIDPNGASSRKNFTLGDWVPSPNGRWVAYQWKENNADEAVLHVRDVSSGAENAQDVVSGANFADVSWAADSQGFYYMQLPIDPHVPEVDRVAHAVIRFHRLGAQPAADPEIYPETGNSSLYLSPKVSRDGHWLFVSVINGWSSVNIYARSETPGAPKTFQPVFVSTYATASVTAWKDQFYITTNDSAPHSRVIRIDPARPGPSVTVIPERRDVILSECDIIGGRLVVNAIYHAASQLEIWDLNGRLIRTLPLPAIGRVDQVSGREDNDVFYFDFQSFSVPRQIYRMSVAQDQPALWAQSGVQVDAAPYRIEQVWYRSKDRTRVSMFLVYRKDAPRNGTMPFILEGYGGFNEPMTPRFNALIYPWLEHGGGYAVPNLRGGGEYGEAWHQAGMLTQKQHTFDDMTAAAAYLIKKRYTRADRLAIQGASNGGLLVGAAVTQRPDLFRAAVCKVPLLDMIRYPLFGEGPAWVSEYGSPKIEAQFKALLGYSPYHHVQAGTAYPAVLLISAESDDRVDPMHARKMAAALQAANTSSHPILLRTLQKSAHGGSGQNKPLIEEFTDRLSFLMNETGLR